MQQIFSQNLFAKQAAAVFKIVNERGDCVDVSILGFLRTAIVSQLKRLAISFRGIPKTYHGV
jgi:hypothetical protein